MPRPLKTTARGYGSRHRAERERWWPTVEAGLAQCWRCGQVIQPGEPWDLGHDDHDRTIYRGPEHRGRCNRRAAAVKGNRARRRTRPSGIDYTQLW